MRSIVVAAWLVVVLLQACHGMFLQEPPVSNPSSFAIDENLVEDASNSRSGLLLTPYIRAGKLKEARQLSEVHLPGVEMKSYAGFLSVNSTFNSQMFYWWFPPKNGKTKDVPVLLWLQGGPGGPSTFGLFVENGPFQVNKDMQVSLRNYTWNQEFGLLFIDNPVGTGFSFTDNDAGYANNEVDVGRDLYEALRQFFTLFDDFHGNPFFLTGESYAGKYVPAIAHKIHSMGPEANKKAGINLQGLAIGDGWCDPRNQLNYGDFLYQVGLIDEAQRDHFMAEQAKVAKLIDEGKFTAAFRVMDDLLDGAAIEHKSFYENATGLSFYYNFLMDHAPPEFEYYSKYLQLNDTRNAIHIGSHSLNLPAINVEKHLTDDMFRSVKPWIEELLNANYRTLFYSGNLDVIVAVPLTENFLKNLQWHKANKYYAAKRKLYKVNSQDNTTAGYVKQVDNLYYVVIRNAGHMVPYDQPRVALDMITRFVKGHDF